MLSIVGDKSAANFQNLRGCQLGLCVTLSSRFVGSLFAQHVLNVDELRADCQMRWIDASRCVTRVQKDRSAWDRAVEEFVVDAVGAPPFAIEPNSPIAAPIVMPNPDQTAAALFRLKHQLIFQGETIKGHGYGEPC